MTVPRVKIWGICVSVKPPEDNAGWSRRMYKATQHAAYVLSDVGILISDLTVVDSVNVAFSENHVRSNNRM